MDESVTQGVEETEAFALARGFGRTRCRSQVVHSSWTT